MKTVIVLRQALQLSAEPFSLFSDLPYVKTTYGSFQFPSLLRKQTVVPVFMALPKTIHSLRFKQLHCFQHGVARYFRLQKSPRFRGLFNEFEQYSKPITQEVASETSCSRIN